MISYAVREYSLAKKAGEACIDYKYPHPIKRTRDKMWLSSLEIMLDILEAYQFTAVRYIEDDRSITLSLNEIDIIENGKDDKEVRLKIGKAIWEYSTEYYNEYEMYCRGPNRKKHVPYIFKALIISCPEKRDILQCQDGES